MYMLWSVQVQTHVKVRTVYNAQPDLYIRWSVQVQTHVKVRTLYNAQPDVYIWWSVQVQTYVKVRTLYNAQHVVYCFKCSDIICDYNLSLWTLNIPSLYNAGTRLMISLFVSVGHLCCCHLLHW